MSAERVKLVVILTVLQQTGEPMTVLSLCARARGERAEVERLVQRLVELGKVRRSGEWVEVIR